MTPRKASRLSRWSGIIIGVIPPVGQSELHRYLAKLPVEKVWGIGHQTTALLNKHGVQTALQFAQRPEAWVKKNFSKPFYQIWQELNGAYIFELVTGEHETYHTIQKVKTFTPPSSDRHVVFAQLAKNVENACIKLRKYKLATERVLIFLRSQDFRDKGLEMDLSGPTSFPNDILHVGPNLAKLQNVANETRRARQQN